MSSKLERIIKMDAMIRSGTYPNIKTFMDHFDVKERTVHDDLVFCRDRLNAPLEYCHTHKGYYYTHPNFPIHIMFATEGELLAFFLTVELAQRYLGTPFEKPLRHAIGEIAQRLPEKVRVDLGQLTEHYSFQTGATSYADPELLVALTEAINEQYQFEMIYYTAGRGERNRRVVEPHHLHNVRGEWQLIAFDHLRNQMRNFAVSRIEEWTILHHKRFHRDVTFSVDNYLAYSFLAERGDTPVDVVIWFDEYQARYIRERQWHPSQHIEEHTDGSLTLTLQTAALEEIQRWIMSYGSHAVVLAPPTLRENVFAEAHQVIANYTGLDE